MLPCGLHFRPAQLQHHYFVLVLNPQIDIYAWLNINSFGELV